MPRRKVNLPTAIYWLFDMRPETIAAGWLFGLPFYCGKSVRPRGRLKEHKTAARRGKSLPVHEGVRECGEFLTLKIVETIPAGGDWVAREKFWIRTLRRLNSNCANISEGGSGSAGHVWSDAQRARQGKIVRARSVCPNYRAKLSAAHKGQRLSPEHREKAAAHLRTVTKTPEYLAGNAARAKARWENPEYRAKMTAVATGRTLSSEARQKISESKRNLSAETRAKLSAAANKRWAAHHA